MSDTRTVRELEAERYSWIACECCRGTTWIPFRMIGLKIADLGSWTLDEVGAKMRCKTCGNPPERYYATRQEDAPGFAKGF